MLGRTLAHYEISSKIGEGGMGDVYRAKDNKLDRDIALKVLPPELAASEERRARFQREAKAIAALNHPNIVTVHSVEEADGVHFITMELVAGRSLKESLQGRRVPLERFYEIAIPLADAVAAAHEAGIVHRDLKPANVMATDDGRIKVLDFGLAQSAPASGGSLDTESPTELKTAEGTLAGTLQYMSPEQAEGKLVDARSDVFALGIMFHQMLSGELPFTGDTMASTLSAILRDEPPKLDGRVPRTLARLVERCLRKDPSKRIQTVRDVYNELEEMATSAESELIARAPARSVTFASVAAALVAGAAAGFFYARAEVDERSPLSLERPLQVTTSLSLEDYPTWSPEAGRVAFHSNESGSSDIWIAQLGGGLPVNRTEDYDGIDAGPSWSPDGTQIAFWSERNGGAYFVMSALGGEPRAVVASADNPLNAPPPQWSADGDRLAVIHQGDNPSFEIFSFDAGDARVIPLPGDDRYRMDPSWSRDGRFLAYVDGIDNTAELTRIWILRLEDEVAFPLTDGASADWSPTWRAGSETLYFVSTRGGVLDLWAQPLDANGESAGDAYAVTAGGSVRRAVFSADGSKLAYSRGRRVANLWRVPRLDGRRATWTDAEQLTSDQAFIEFVDVAPDGTLLFSSDRAGTQGIWSLSADRASLQPLTSSPTPDWDPTISPDSSTIAFYSSRSGNRDIWTMPFDGGQLRQLTSDDAGDVHPAWSPDGTELAFASQRGGAVRNLWIASADGSNERQLTSDNEVFDNFPRWSPRGDWIGFLSTRGDGIQRIWRMRPSGDDLRPVSTEPAGPMRWTDDGGAVYFIGLGPGVDDVWAHELDTGNEYRLTDLSGRRGRMGKHAIAVDDNYVYFSWEEDLGDIWVMDVASESGASQ